MPYFLYIAPILFGMAIAIVTAVALRTLKSRPMQTTSSQTSMRRQDMRTRALKSSLTFRVILPLIRFLAGPVERLDLESLRHYTRASYAKAGYPGGLDDDEVVALGFLLGILTSLFLGFTIAVLGSATYAPFGLLGVPIGFLILVSSLKSRAQVREVQILQALPYMLDLMVLLLRAGTSLRIALGRVVADYEDHPIGVEIGQVLAEIDVGSSRIDAFRRLSARLRINDIDSVVDSLVQSEELGWPLADSLERLSDRLSSERILRAQAKAGAAGVIVMIPSTLVLLAAVILLFGPIIVRILRSGTIVQ